MRVTAWRLGVLGLCWSAGCGGEEESGGPLNDEDLDRLRIETVDAASVHVFALPGVVDAETPIHVWNVTQGPEASTVALEDGSFDVAIAGAVDHVYELRSGEDDPVPVVRQEAGTAVRGYGVGFSSPQGCTLQGWTGLIRDSAGDARTSCALGGTLEGEEEVVRGPVEPFVLRRDTRLVLVAAVGSVEGAPPRFSVDFLDAEDHATSITVQSQNAAGQYGPTEMIMGSLSSELPGKTVASLAIRSPIGAGLAVADLTFTQVGLPSD